MEEKDLGCLDDYRMLFVISYFHFLLIFQRDQFSYAFKDELSSASQGYYQLYTHFGWKNSKIVFMHRKQRGQRPR
jgi:hypothetical protein